ncbi:hypothetical protein K461DRAFT_276168 [Myriangium duriaei CBS 260.36]|uniref:S-adenosylmethionine tRNA ribosyltransferase n=1 Tax=Myriangium duriaei CBS 260.36 TaxID=1168546 RepID=A0A9P4J563_9PEZI|nr:hypothetical protein K461DRAFT_276168 [Myriangium duriaei CBS 260.36]
MTSSDPTLAVEKHMQHLLESRQPPKTFCPSEVARALTNDELKALDLNDWRKAMVTVRELAWKLRDAGELEILQKGTVLDPDTQIEDVTGPIRLRRCEGGEMH